MAPYSSVVMTLVACSVGMYLSEASPLLPTPKRVAQTILMAAALTVVLLNFRLLYNAP